MVIDTHCHLSKEDYPDLVEVIDRMKDHAMIVSGADHPMNEEALRLSSQYPNIYATIGIHPTEITDHWKEELSWIEEQLNNKKVVGIGEIGLDYHRPDYNADLQRQVFIFQIELAKKYHKPIVIHSRDAIEETYQILKEHHVEEMRCVMHCYSSSVEMARLFTKLGVKLGIGGVVTFKNAQKLVEVVKEIPLPDLLLETDCPYLTPEPYRGERNEPFYVTYVAKKIAEIKHISYEEVIDVTTKTAICQFDLDIEL